MKTILTVLLGLVVSYWTNAQEEKSNLKGKHELSPALTFQYMKEKDYDGDWYLSVPIRWTYFITDKVGVGAELFTSLVSEGDPGVIISGMFEYNIPAGRAYPFLTLGGGVSNGAYLLDRIAFSSYEDILAVITIGSGVKIPFSQKILFRIDVQYRRFSGKSSYDMFIDETDRKIRMNYVITAFGISLLL